MFLNVVSLTFQEVDICQHLSYILLQMSSTTGGEATGFQEPWTHLYLIHTTTYTVNAVNPTALII